MDALRRAVQVEQRKIEEEALGSPHRASWPESAFTRPQSNTSQSIPTTAWRSSPSRTDRLAARAQREASQSNSPLWNPSFAAISPNERKSPQVAVWRGTLLEELGERPLVAQGRGGLLCVRATERGACWGSLRCSWLAKNTFEEWRSLVLKRHIGEDRRVELVVEPATQVDNTAELERLLEEKDRLISQLEGRLDMQQVKVDVSRWNEAIDTDAIASSVLAGLQNRQPRDRGLDTDTDLSVSEIQGEFQRMREQLVLLREELRSEFRAMSQDVESPGASVASEIRALRREVSTAMEAFTSDSQLLGSIGNLDRKLDRLERKVDFTDLKIQPDISSVHQAISDSSRSLVEVVQSSTSPPDHSPILEAISMLASKVDSDVLGAIRRIRFDHSPILDAIKNQDLRVDHSEVLSAIRRIRLQPDFSPIFEAMESNQKYMMEAIEKLDQAELMSTVRRLRAPVDLSSLQTTIEVNHRSMMEALKATRGDLKTELSDVQKAVREIAQGDLSAFETVLDNKHRGLLDDIQRVRSADHAPVLQALEQVNHNEVLHTLRDFRREVGTKLGPLHESVHLNHRQMLSAVESAKVDHSPVMEALRQLGRDHKMHLAPLQEQLDTNHRSLHDRLEANHRHMAESHRDLAESHRDLSQALSERTVAEQQVRRSSSASELKPRHVVEFHERLEAGNRNIIEELGTQIDVQPHFSSLHERIDGWQQGFLDTLQAGQLRILEAVEALRNEDRHPRVSPELLDALRSQNRHEGHDLEPQHVSALHDRIHSANREVIEAVETAKLEHLEVLQAFRAIVSERGSMPDLSQVHETIRASREETVRDVVSALETAVDHSPLLTAIGSFELKGHSEAHAEVLASLKALRLDLNMEPDFSPVLHMLRELPTAAEQNQLHAGIQKIRMDLSSVLQAISAGQRELITTLEALNPQNQTRSLSPVSGQDRLSPGPRRRKYIVTLGGEAAQGTGSTENMQTGVAQAVHAVGVAQAAAQAGVAHAASHAGSHQVARNIFAIDAQN